MSNEKKTAGIAAIEGIPKTAVRTLELLIWR